ncbi:MAG: UV DNA damage repair endonuclease UvsE [Desulfofustis sp.]|nr:UV DNA damage repair endonuclease UvsE [Desulfofustis sp.]
MRLGLCCLFKNEPVRFRTTTATALANRARPAQLLKLSEICRSNAENLLLAVQTIRRLGIGAFRIMSPLFPRMTHPQVGYRLEQLDDGETIGRLLEATRSYARQHEIRLSFHPDQFVVLSSPHPEVVANSVRELEYQAFLAEAVGAEVINLHAGGVYGDKQLALQRLRRVVDKLPQPIRSRLTLENDDISYSVSDLLPVCEELSLPLVYDVHHHRCLPDGLSVEEATRLAGETWDRLGREQYCHLSSPQAGWAGANLKPHADYIDPADLPICWLERPMTVDIEAKAKELAILQLIQEIDNGQGMVKEDIVLSTRAR